MKYKTINSDKFHTPYSDAIEIGSLVEFSGMIGNDENGLVDGGFLKKSCIKYLKISRTHCNIMS